MVPNAHYDCIDMLRSPLGEVGSGDLATAMVLLERARSREEFAAALLHAAEVVRGQGLERSDLERALVRWVCDELVGPWSAEEKAAMLREVQDLDEALSAIQLRIKEWAAEAKRSRAEGRREGLVDSPLIVLRARFGRVRRDVERRIRQADVQQLRRWLRRAAKAESLDAVFDRS